jgi:hypothetical protein
MFSYKLKQWIYCAIRCALIAKQPAILQKWQEEGGDEANEKRKRGVKLCNSTANRNVGGVSSLMGS